MYVFCKCIFGSILGFINVSIKLFVYIFGGAQCPRLHLQIDTKLGRDLPRHRLQPRPGLPHRGLDLVLGYSESISYSQYSEGEGLYLSLLLVYSADISD